MKKLYSFFWIFLFSFDVKQLPPMLGAPPQSPGIVSMGQGSMVPPAGHQSRAQTAQSVNRRFSNAQEHNVNQVKQHVHDRLEHVRPRKVKIDGFRFGDERSTGPFAWQITTPIK